MAPNNNNTSGRKGDPITADRFEVYFGNSTKIGFSRISNINMAENVEAITDAGNDETHLYADEDDEDKLDSNVLVLERAVTTDESDKRLREYVAGVKIDSLTIKIMQNGKAVRILEVHGAVVSKWGFSDLDATASSVMMRRIEIRHSGIEEMDVT